MQTILLCLKLSSLARLIEFIIACRNQRYKPRSGIAGAGYCHKLFLHLAPSCVKTSLTVFTMHLRSSRIFLLCIYSMSY